MKSLKLERFMNIEVPLLFYYHMVYRIYHELILITF